MMPITKFPLGNNDLLLVLTTSIVMTCVTSSPGIWPSFPTSTPPHHRMIWGGSFHRETLFTRRCSNPLSFMSKTSPSPPSLTLTLRGGDDANADTTTTTTTMESAESATTIDKKGEQKEEEEEEEVSLDEKVQAAMKRLGLVPPGSGEGHHEEEEQQQTKEGHSSTSLDKSNELECKDGVCTVPPSTSASGDETTLSGSAQQQKTEQDDVNTIAERISAEMKVDKSIALAAIGATASFQQDNQSKIDETAAREMIQTELDAIKNVPEDCDEVKQLVSEGHDPFLSRRALAFAEMNINDARAILIADEEDEKMERQREAEEAAALEEEEVRALLRAEAEDAKKEEEETLEMKTVHVDANFDPTALGGGGGSGGGGGGNSQVLPSLPQQQSPPVPKSAKKSDVVFDATSSQIQSLVLESPVPVLLDVYADWCGPCKALTPALEQMAVKAGGMFRLVKINTDNERPISTSLEVTALPTVFGIRDGKVVNMFRGMPRDEEFMRNFMMGLLTPGATFDPPVTLEQKRKFEELSNKLTKVAGAASFPFSQRERLQDRTTKRLDELVEACKGDAADAEESARTIRSLLSNIIRNPSESKFRKVNLENKIIAARVSQYAPCIAILKSVGFVPEGEGGKSIMVLAKEKKLVNVAPLVIARDCIDKWIDRNRYKAAAAARRKKDEMDRARLKAEAEAAGVEEDEDDDEQEQEETDPDACTIKLRLEGKKKVHDLAMHGDDPLHAILDALPRGIKVAEGQVVQITCTARRLVVRSTDEESMRKTIREHKLFPAASLVIKIGDGASSTGGAGGSLAERAAQRTKKKKGSHTMQSVGIYAKDDNAKGELIDGGGGVWFEHDVTDTEDEGEGMSMASNGVDKNDVEKDGDEETNDEDI